MSSFKGYSLIIFSWFCWASPAWAKKPSLVIFDVDDTLMDTRGRTLEILHEVGKELAIPELITLEPNQVDADCPRSCQNAGLKSQELISLICGPPEDDTIDKSAWGRRFFLDPEYLHYDLVVSGASKFVGKIRSELNATIAYLSGRKEVEMLEETKQQLRYHRFPVELDSDPKTIFMLKPGDAINNLDFKKKALEKLLEEYEVIAVFDDNKSNVNMFRESLDPAVPILRPCTNVRDTSGVFQGITQIGDYFYNISFDCFGKSKQSNQISLQVAVEAAKQFYSRVEGSKTVQKEL